MATVKWDPRAVFQDFEQGRVEGTIPVYHELLSRCPVAYIDPESIDERGEVGYWGVFGYAELTTAAGDFTTFSNVTPVSGPRILPLQSDPPEHAGYRRMLNPFFSKDVVAQVERAVRGYGGAMIDAMVARGEADFAQEFAFPFPTRVLCTFLGLPEDDWQFHHDWVVAMERATGNGLRSPAVAVPPELGQEMVPYIQDMIRRRRSAPGDDVVSGIIGSEVDGHPLDDDTITYLVMTIMMAGHITTTSAIGGFVARLARDPSLQDHLRAHPERIPDAVDETLRIDGPQQAMPRRCTRDTQVGGQEVKAGEYVVLNFGSANVDPRRWPAPEEFDVDRVDKRHVAFGRGLHLCIGQHLARMEMRLAVEELLARTDSFRPAGDVHRTVWPLTTVEHMPLVLVAATSGGTGR